MKKLIVGRVSADFIKRGHPWVRPDKFTQGLEKLETGEAVTLVDQQGHGIASALIDRHDATCARVYHQRPDRPFQATEAFYRAWEKRAALHADEQTTCYRIVHGEADFLPGLRVERYGNIIVLVLLAPCMQVYLDKLIAAAQNCAPEARLVIKEHTTDIRKEQIRCYDRNRQNCDPNETVIAQECGAFIEVAPFADLATGIYVDQRCTRTWLHNMCAGKSVLNLFAYTGVFSSSLLVAGASQAVDVDLSGPALETAVRNAELNAVSQQHTVVKSDCGSFLKQDNHSYDIIIVDPPTSARGASQAKKGNWILRRDYPALLAAASKRLSPHGMIISCCNTLGKPFPLANNIDKALPDATVVSAPQLADDIPQKKGFPEGRPWRMEIRKRSS